MNMMSHLIRLTRMGIITKWSKIGCIIELKYAEAGDFDSACAEALNQISEKKYTDYLLAEDMQTIYCYAVACYKKNCKVVCQHYI